MKSILRILSLLIAASVWLCWVLFIVCIFISCNPVKKVMQDPAKLEKVGREWEKKNPCYPLTEIKPGKEIIVHDTLQNDSLVNVLNHAVDSLIRIKCIEKNTGDLEALRKSVEDKLRKDCAPVHHYHTRVDTVPDMRRLNILNDSLNFYRGRTAQLHLDIKHERRRGNKWMIFCLSLVGITIIKYFLKIRYPKLSWL